MTRHQIEELLSKQADRLTAGQEEIAQERAAGLASLDRAGLTRDDQRTLGGLMRLARQVQVVLVEVEPRPAFTADLKARLLAQRRSAGQPEANGGRARILVWGVAGALSLAGLGFLGYRAARVGAGWISAAATSRGARPVLPKA